MTVDSPQTAALARLSELEARFDADPDSALVSFVEEIEALARSVETFHMEAIRFRYFGLRRRLTNHDGPLPSGAVELLDEVGQALSAAGFQIR